MPVESITLADITSELLAALRMRHAHHDLSREGAVAHGAFTGPPAGAPFCCVVPPRFGTREGRARSQIWERIATYTVRAWAPFDRESQEARADTGTTLAEDLVRALEDRFTSRDALLHSADQLTVVGALLDPVVADLAPDFAVVELTVEVRYRRVVGA